MKTHSELAKECVAIVIGCKPFAYRREEVTIAALIEAHVNRHVESALYAAKQSTYTQGPLEGRIEADRRRDKYGV